MTPEKNLRVSLNSKEPVELTKNVFPQAIRKISNFLKVIYGENIPSNIDKKLKGIEMNLSEYVSIDESNLSDRLNPNDTDSDNTLAKVDLNNGLMYFPGYASESTVIHECFHCLSADAKEKKIGFYNGDYWTYYFNESFTNLLTVYTKMQKPGELLFQLNNLSDRSNRYVYSILENGYDPMRESVNSYMESYENLIDVLSNVPIDKFKGVMKTFFDAYFSRNINKAIMALNEYTYEDFSDFDRKKGLPIKYRLSDYLVKSFETLSTKDLSVWRNGLLNLKLKKGIFPDRETNAEDQVLSEMINLITQEKKYPDVDITILFPEFTQERSIQFYNFDKKVQILLNCDLLRVSKYLILEKVPLLRDSYREILIEMAEKLAEEGKIFKMEKVLNAKKSFEKRILKMDKTSENYDNKIKVLKKYLSGNSPQDITSSIIIKTIFGLDDVSYFVVEDIANTHLQFEKLINTKRRLDFYNKRMKKYLKENNIN